MKYTFFKILKALYIVALFLCPILILFFDSTTPRYADELLALALVMVVIHVATRMVGKKIPLFQRVPSTRKHSIAVAHALSVVRFVLTAVASIAAYLFWALLMVVLLLGNGTLNVPAIIGFAAVVAVATPLSVLSGYFSLAYIPTEQQHAYMETQRRLDILSAVAAFCCFATALTVLLLNFAQTTESVWL